MKNIVSFRDRFIEALKNGKTEEALEIFEELYQGALTTHDRLVDYCNLLLTFVSQKSGEEGVKEAWESVIDIFHKKSLRRLEDLTHPQRVDVLLKEHLHHGSEVSIEDYSDRTVISLHTCGSGGRIRAQGRTDLHPGSPIPGGTTRKKYRWAFAQKGIPYYCCHCNIISDLYKHWKAGFKLEIRYGQQFNAEGKQVGPPCQFILYKEGAKKKGLEER
jgi:hypothetical protein